MRALKLSAWSRSNSDRQLSYALHLGRYERHWGKLSSTAAVLITIEAKLWISFIGSCAWHWCRLTLLWGVTRHACQVGMLLALGKCRTAQNSTEHAASQVSCACVLIMKARNGSWIMDHGSWIMDHGSWIMDHGSWIMDHGSWIMDHGSWIMDNGSWIMDHGSWIMNHGSWITDHGSCRHAMDNGRVRLANRYLPYISPYYRSPVTTINLSLFQYLLGGLLLPQSIKLSLIQAFWCCSTISALAGLWPVRWLGGAF